MKYYDLKFTFLIPKHLDFYFLRRLIFKALRFNYKDFKKISNTRMICILEHKKPYSACFYVHFVHGTTEQAVDRIALMFLEYIKKMINAPVEYARVSKFNTALSEGQP